MRSVLVGLMVLSGGVFVPAKLPPVPTVPAPTCHPAELFVSDDTDPLFEIAGRRDDRSERRRGDGIDPARRRVLVNRAAADQLRAVARIPSLQSRRAHVAHPRRGAAPAVPPRSGADLRLPAPGCAGANAVTVTVPDIDLARFRAAFVVRSGRTPSTAGRIRHHHRPHPDPGHRHWRSRSSPADSSALRAGAGMRPTSPTADANSWIAPALERETGLTLEHEREAGRTFGARTIPTRWCRAACW